MIPIHSKEPSLRTATATASVIFSNPAPYNSIIHHSNLKGDVLAVARIAAIQGAKKCSDLIPLAHPIGITGGDVDVAPIAAVKSNAVVDGGGEEGGTGRKDFGRVAITATVSTVGRTGVEMEALSACLAGALTVFDMCKGVDRGIEITGATVVRKEGGRSGTWVWGERVEGGEGGGDGQGGVD